MFQHDGGNIYVKHLLVFIPGHIALFRLVTQKPGMDMLKFVVAAPEGDAGMMAHALDVIGQFCLNIRDKLLIRAGIRAAREHQILPDRDAVAVAQVVKHVIFINAAAPDAQHVHVGLRCAGNQVFVKFRSDAGDERVCRNPVRAFRKIRHAVDDKLKRFAPLVGVAIQHERPQSDSFFLSIHDGFAVEQVKRDVIQRLPAQSIRPPQLRVDNRQCRFYTVIANIGGCFGDDFSCEHGRHACSKRDRRSGFDSSAHAKLHCSFL